jgi:hypothetical protein
VSNIALLERYQGKKPERDVIEIEVDNAGWKMEKIIASGPSNDNAMKHVYLVKWEGFLYDESTSETFMNVDENARELFKEYYAENANVEKDKRFGINESREKDAGSAGKRMSQKHRNV